MTHSKTLTLIVLIQEIFIIVTVFAALTLALQQSLALDKYFLNCMIKPGRLGWAWLEALRDRPLI